MVLAASNTVALIAGIAVFVVVASVLSMIIWRGSKRIQRSGSEKQ